jgi:GNAT superfamily N-acetyltransferase
MKNSKEIPYKPIFMIRRSVDGVPQFDFPDGFVAAFYRPGDKSIWLDIHHQCYDPEGRIKITPETFDQNFGTNHHVLAQRQLYVFDITGRAVGSTTAWFNDNYRGEKFGQIHWVAIVPDCQGKGLAKPMMTAAMNRFKELGHTRVYLGTQTTRIPAIQLYLKFGFDPDIRTDEDKENWGLLKGIISNPMINGLKG